jgi:hypothetical protein
MRGTNTLKETEMESCAEWEIRPGIKELVDVLNTMPGITTTSSCGGREHSANPEKQAAADEFYIDFTVDISNGGWSSLGLITQLAWSTGGEDITIRTWYTASKCLAFTINGKNDASPDKLARVLEIALVSRKGLPKANGRDLFYWCG